MKTLNDYFNDIEKIDTKFRNKDKFIDFLFEYAYQSLEYHKKEKSQVNLNILINNKLNIIYLTILHYKKFSYYNTGIIICTPKYDSKMIREIIKYEEKQKVDGLFKFLRLKNG